MNLRTRIALAAIAGLASLGLAQAQRVPAETAKQVIAAAHAQAQKTHCDVEEPPAKNVIAFTPERYGVWFILDGEKFEHEGKEECNRGSGTAHYVLTEVVKDGQGWRIAEQNHFSALLYTDSFNARFVSAVQVVEAREQGGKLQAVLNIESQELSDRGNFPDKAFRYTVSIPEGKLLKKEALPEQ